MEFLTNFVLTTYRPLLLVVTLYVISLIAVNFVSAKMGRVLDKHRNHFLWLAILFIVGFGLSNPVITPQNKPKVTGPTVTVPVELPPAEIVDLTRQPALTEEERNKRFEEISDWKNRDKPKDQ